VALEFAEFAFVALVALEATLFSAFGVLYSVYATHMAALTAENPIPAKICIVLKRLCRALAAILLIAAAVSLACLWHIAPRSGIEVVIAVGLAICIISISLVSFIISLKV